VRHAGQKAADTGQAQKAVDVGQGRADHNGDASAGGGAGKTEGEELKPHHRTELETGPAEAAAFAGLVDDIVPKIMPEGRCNVSAATSSPREDSVPAPARTDGIFRKFAGERFFFDVSWMGIHVGSAVMETSEEKGVVAISSRVRSAAVLSAFYKVEDYSESTLLGGTPLRFRIRQHEGRYRSDKETVFDATGRKIVYFDYRKGMRKESPMPEDMVWDVISGFYYLRTRPLDVGETVYVDLFDSNKFLHAAVHVVRKEKIRGPGMGEVGAVVVKPVLKSEGLFQNKGDISIWLSDDANRIPLRVETSVPIGKVVAELRKVESIR
jgi:hypothetical protein